MFSSKISIKRFMVVFSCLVALFGGQLIRGTVAGAGSSQPHSVSPAPSAMTAAKSNPLPAAARQELEQRLNELRGQMASLKEQLALNDTDRKLWDQYEKLNGQINEVYNQIYKDDVPQPLVPEVTSCIAGTLSATSKTMLRPNTTSTGSGIGTCPSATTVRYNVYQFNLTGCTTFPTQVTMSLCGGSIGGSGCATVAAFDSIILLYRSTGNLTTNGSTGNAFNPSSICTNLVAANDELSGTSIAAGGSSCDGAGACHPACGAPGSGSVSGMIRTIGSGFFQVVVAGFSAGTVGSYNLFVSAPGASCNLNAPTAVKLEMVSATSYEDGVGIDWKTGREVDNLGFNVYRDEGGKRARVNPETLAGSGLLVGPRVNLESGGSYSWIDNTPVRKNTKYWLEELGMDGQSTWYGPVDVNRSAPGDRVPPSKGRAKLLSKLGSEASQASQGSPPRVAKSPPMSIAGLTDQSDLAMRPAMKLAVKQEGWYRVNQPELGAAGFDTKTDPRMLQLFVDGQQQAISVIGEEDGRFDSNDAVEFYGLGADSAYTDSRTYWLASGSQPGLRVEKVKGKGTRAAPSSFPYTVERRDRSVYFSALRNGNAENFFGAVVARGAVDQSINVQHLDTAGSGAELELALQGVTEISHRVRVELNGTEVGAMGFEGQSAGITKIPLGRTVLKEGQNIVRLIPFGGESDVSLVEYVRVTYPHTYTADGDALRFSLSGKQQVSIDGFTSSAIRVIDVTEPDAVREVTSRVEARKGSYAVTVSAPKGGGERLLLAFAGSQANGPAAMTLNRPSNLREPGRGADLVIITHRDFLNSVAPLKAARERQGLSVEVVDVENVYDEFSFGQKSPQAVKDFLAFARSSWQTPPRYALLVGDASFDPKGYLGFGDSDLVPTMLIDTRLMETASDDWFVDLNGDGAVEMSIGRLPVRTPDEAAAMIAKILGYDGTEPVDRVMLVADSNDDFDFEAVSAGLRSAIPRNVLVREINRGRDGPAAESEFIAGLDQGQKIVNYVGHGNVDQWRGRLLTSAGASGLTNSRHLPLFVMMTCLNGYFHDASVESLAESLMKTPRGGAVAVWASSGMTAPTEQASLNREILRLVLDNATASSLTLGEATVKAKSAVNAGDVRRTWILFGDPTMRLR